MEMIKDIVRQFYPLLILTSCVLFVMGVFFSAPIYSGEGVFEGAGELFSPVADTGEIKSEGISYIEGSVSGYMPVIRYASGVQKTGSYIVFKDMFIVQKEDGSVVSGSEEDGFAIYLLDIKNHAGKSVLLTLSAEEIEALEEIPAPFVYEEEQDILCCFLSGVYTVQIKVYGAHGGQEIYEFQLPVEVM